MLEKRLLQAICLALILVSVGALALYLMGYKDASEKIMYPVVVIGIIVASVFGVSLFSGYHSKKQTDKSNNNGCDTPSG